MRQKQGCSKIKSKATEPAKVLIEIMREYNCSDAQLGFQRKTGIETASRRHIANQKELRFSAVLDLKSGFNIVPRITLMDVVGRKVKRNTNNMIRLDATANDPNGKDVSGVISTCGRGLIHGSHWAPQYKIYSYKYAEEVRRSQKTVQTQEHGRINNEIVLYFNDSMIQVRVTLNCKNCCTCQDRGQ